MCWVLMRLQTKSTLHFLLSLVRNLVGLLHKDFGRLRRSEGDGSEGYSACVSNGEEEMGNKYRNGQQRFWQTLQI